MAKFRTNHKKSGQSKTTTARILAFIVLFIAGGVTLYEKMADFNFETPRENTNQNSNQGNKPAYTKPAYQVRDFLPQEDKDQVINHAYYSLAYVEKHEQAKWVAYELTREQLNSKKVPRAKRFNPDYDVTTRSAFHRDYTHSGYTRGHLAPAGDMGFNQEAMQESFFMSNMSPQIREFNNGIWRELEEQTRDWARKFNHLYIVVGPILNNIQKKIGDNKVSVPDKFYKVLLDLSEPEVKAIGFIIPHEKSTKHLHEFAVSIDQIEKVTGINFFEGFLDSAQEKELEANYDTKLWKVDNKRFRQRVEKWNNQ
jgi:endonuclease G